MAELLAGAAAASAGSTALSLVPIAGTAASAANAAAGLGLSSTVLGILQGVATATSVLGTLTGAASQRDQLLSEAMATEIEAGQGQLESQNRVTAMKRELLQVLGANRVTAAAAGIDLQGGLPRAQEQAQKEAAAGQMSIERDDDQMRRALLKARANGLRARSRDTLTGGLFKAFGTAAGFGADLVERG